MSALSLCCVDFWDGAQSTRAGEGVEKKRWREHFLSRAFHFWEMGWEWILLGKDLSKQVDSRLAIYIYYFSLPVPRFQVPFY